jgi:hypothetical protein
VLVVLSPVRQSMVLGRLLLCMVPVRSVPFCLSLLSVRCMVLLPLAFFGVTTTLLCMTAALLCLTTMLR